MNPRIAAGKPVRQHVATMRPGDIGHAGIGLVRRLQRQPEADLVVAEGRVTIVERA